MATSANLLRTCTAGGAATNDLDGNEQYVWPIQNTKPARHYHPKAVPLYAGRSNDGHATSFSRPDRRKRLELGPLPRFWRGKRTSSTTKHVDPRNSVSEIRGVSGEVSSGAGFIIEWRSWFRCREVSGRGGKKKLKKEGRCRVISTWADANPMGARSLKGLSQGDTINDRALLQRNVF